MTLLYEVVVWNGVFSKVFKRGAVIEDYPGCPKGDGGSFFDLYMKSPS